MVYNHDNHKSRGFGFIIFKETASVRKVVSFTDHIIMGRRVEVKPALPKAIENSMELPLPSPPTVSLLPGEAVVTAGTSASSTISAGTPVMPMAMSSSEQAYECFPDERKTSSYSSSTPTRPPFANTSTSSLSLLSSSSSSTSSSSTPNHLPPSSSTSLPSSAKPFFSSTVNSSPAELIDSPSVNKHLSQSWTVSSTLSPDISRAAMMESASGYQSSGTNTGEMHFQYEQPMNSDLLEERSAEENNRGSNYLVCFAGVIKSTFLVIYSTLGISPSTILVIFYVY